MKKLDKNNFKETIDGDNYILVDFWAEWCGPCKMIAPVLEEISNERTDVAIAKLNVDDNQEIALTYGVQSIPTMILFKNGKVVDKLIGALPKEKINQFLNKEINK
jgi:thioredoxin 1